MENNCTAKEAVRSSEVSSANSCLTDSINSLETLVEDFLIRIQPIINEKAEPESGTKDVALPNLCELADTITNHDSRIKEVSRKLRKAKSFIEL